MPGGGDGTRSARGESVVENAEVTEAALETGVEAVADAAYDAAVEVDVETAEEDAEEASVEAAAAAVYIAAHVTVEARPSPLGCTPLDEAESSSSSPSVVSPKPRAPHPSSAVNSFAARLATLRISDSTRKTCAKATARSVLEPTLIIISLHHDTIE